MATSRRAHTSRYLLGPPPPEPQRASGAAGRSGPGNRGVAALPRVPVRVEPRVRPPRVESLFPAVLWGSSPSDRPRRLGSLPWGPEPSLLWESICDVIIFQIRVARQQSSSGDGHGEQTSGRGWQGGRREEQGNHVTMCEADASDSGKSSWGSATT
ncbi:uncharacterized protein ACBT57_024013 [Dama dama]